MIDKRRTGFLAALLVLSMVFAWKYYLDRGQEGAHYGEHGNSTPIDGVPMDDWAAVPASVSAPPSSAWLEARTTRYAALFKNWKCDTLVVPVQIEEGGFDRPNRQIMSAELALALSFPGQCVADPFLADIALGDSLRRRDDKAVRDLARTIRARRIVTAYAGHDDAGSMRVTLQVSQTDADHPAALPRITAAHSFNGLHYDAEHPPFAAFAAQLPQMLAAVNLQSAPPSPAPGGALPAQLPQSLDLYKRPPDEPPVAQAAHLLFLAMMGPYEWRATSRLFSKAWLALQAADPNDPLVRRMRARIMLHLWERPYALALLGDSPGPAAEGLRAILNGNLPQARNALAQVREPWEQLFLALEVHDLELYQYREPRQSAAYVLRLMGGTQWKYFAARRLGDADEWEVGSTQPIKALLDQSFPAADFSLADNSIVESLTKAFDTSAAELLTLRHLYWLEQWQPQLWCCKSFSAAPGPSDLLDLLDSRIQYTLGHQAYYEYSPQGAYDRALGLLEQYDSLLAGDPCNEELRAWIYDAQLKQGELGKRAELEQRLRQSARITAWLEQGQTRDSNFMLWYLHQSPHDPAEPLLRNYTQDYPPRAFWQWYGHHAVAEERLAFSSFDAHPLAELIRSSSGDKRAGYLAMLDSRFLGDGDATQLRLDNLPADQLTPEYLRGLVASDPDNWALRNALGKALLARDDFGGVRDAILGYPPFAEDKPKDPVALSNFASGWGHDLLWVGAFGEARPLLQKAADYNTGSGAGGFSTARIALLGGDFGAAAESFSEVAQHYRSFIAYREQASLMFAAGMERQAWALFDEVTGRYDDHGLWASAMVAHRRASLDDAGLNAWFAERLARTKAGEDRDNLRSYAFLEQVVDRAPAAGFADAMKALAGPSEVAVRPGGRTYLQGAQQDANAEIGPSAFGRGRHARLNAGLDLPDRYQLAAAAMLAWRAGRYDESVSDFDRLASAYTIEHGTFSVLLPYFAFAAAKSGDKLGLQQFLEQLPAADQGYEVTLARAVFAGLAGNKEAALKLLGSGFHDWAYADAEHFPISAYWYLATCILIYEDTHEDRYRQAALRLARPLRRAEPAFAFGHAVVAYLSDDHEERVEALALAAYLDPRSYWAGKVPAAVQSAARAWLDKNPSPFSKGRRGWAWYDAG